MNIISQIQNFGKQKQQKQFYIYDIGVLNAKTEQEYAQYIALKFDGVVDYDYSNQSDIPYQPLENGSFNTDSILDTPFLLRLTGAVTMAYSDHTVVQNYDGISNIVIALENALSDNTQFIIYGGYPFFVSYEPMKLKRINYGVNPNNITLMATLEFQEIRSAITTGSLSNTDTLKNPTNSNTGNSGIVTPSVVTPYGDLA